MAIVEGLKAGLRGFVDLLTPPVCMVCRAPVRDARTLCADCWSALPLPGDARCVQCGIPLPQGFATESHCLSCLKEPPAFDAATAPFLYDGSARLLVIRFKNGRERWAAPLARDMARAAPEWIAPGHLLLPVPLHPLRLAKRGYNQSLLLARALGRAGGAEVAPDWLERVKNTRSTRGMRAEQRRRNVAGAFRIRPGCEARIPGQHITLVDDVLTTGATAAACARVLRRAGAASISVLTYARVASDHSAPYLAGEAKQEAHGQS